MLLDYHEDKAFEDYQIDVNNISKKRRSNSNRGHTRDIEMEVSIFLLTLFSSSTWLFPIEKTLSFFKESIFSRRVIRLLYNDRSVSSVKASRPSIRVILLNERSVKSEILD